MEVISIPSLAPSHDGGGGGGGGGVGGDSLTSIKDSLTALSKWKLALLLGAPFACASGWYYWQRRRSSHSKKVDAASVKDFPSNSAAPTRSLSVAIASKDAGNQLLKKGKLKEAVSVYTRAILECPCVNGTDVDTTTAAAGAPFKSLATELAKIYQNRAYAHEQLGDLAASLTDCDEAIRLDPAYVRAWSRRAKVRESSGDLAGSLDDATAVCILEQFRKEESLKNVDRILKAFGAKEAATRYRSRQAPPPSPQFVRTYFAAFYRDPIFPKVKDNQTSSSRYGDIDSSETSLFLDARRRVKECRSLETIVDLCRQELESASSDYRREARLLKATFLMLQGSGDDEALEDLNSLLQAPESSNIDNEDDAAHDLDIRVNALIKRASLRIRKQEETEALTDFEAAQSMDPLNSDVFHHRAQLNLLMDKCHDACLDFEKCVELAPNFAVARLQSVFTRYRYRQSVMKGGGGGGGGCGNDSTVFLKEAKRSFEELLVKNTDCAEGWALYGQIMLDEKQFAEAERLFLKALEVEPDNGNVYVHLGLCHLQWDCHGLDSQVVETRSVSDSCRRYLEKALEVDPQCEFAYETLGTVEVQNGRLDRASELFEKAISVAKTEMEMAHLISLNAAARAQIQASEKLGINVGSNVHQ